MRGLLAVLVLLVAATAAAGTPGQQLADDSAGWLRGQGFTVTHQTLLPMAAQPDELSSGLDVEPWALTRSDRPEAIFADDSFLARIDRAARGGRVPPLRLAEAVQTLLHEQLHQPGRVAVAAEWRHAILVEEGVVDAVAIDLTPLYVRRRFGVLVRRGAPGYPDQVRNIRAASAKATGSRSWRTPAAFRWRVELLLADPDERAALLSSLP